MSDSRPISPLVNAKRRKVGAFYVAPALLRPTVGDWYSEVFADGENERLAAFHGPSPLVAKQRALAYPQLSALPALLRELCEKWEADACALESTPSKINVEVTGALVYVTRECAAEVRSLIAGLDGES